MALSIICALHSVAMHCLSMVLDLIAKDDIFCNNMLKYLQSTIYFMYKCTMCVPDMTFSDAISGNEPQNNKLHLLPKLNGICQI